MPTINEAIYLTNEEMIIYLKKRADIHSKVRALVKKEVT